MRNLTLFLLTLAACPAPKDNPPSAAQPTSTASHGKCVRSCDLKTDDGVGALFTELTGRSLGPKLECIARPAELPQVVVVGSFASDRGCALIGSFVDCCYNDATQSGSLLNLGWKELSPEKKSALALRWTTDVLLAFQQAMTEATDDFGAEKTFHPPMANSLPNGGVAVDFWFRPPSGMLPQKAPLYEQKRYSFSAEAILAPVEVLQSFEGAPFETSSPLKP